MARIVHGFAAFALGLGALGIALTCSRVARADEPVGPPAPHATEPAAASDPPSDRVLSPSAVGVAPLLLQRVAGIDLVAGVRERALVGGIGSEVDARLTLARRDGNLSLVATGMLRRAMGTRDDTDAQADVTATVDVTRAVRVGAEGRVRGEVVDGVVASDDVGRPVEVVAGAVAGVSVAGVELVGLGGAAWPRGPLPSGPIALGGAAFSF